MDENVVARLSSEASSVEHVFPSVADALRVAAAEIVCLRAEVEQLTAERDELSARLVKQAISISCQFDLHDAERALADQLAEALRWVSDPELCEESHETIIGIWQSTAAALAAYEAARKESNDE